MVLNNRNCSIYTGSTGHEPAMLGSSSRFSLKMTGTDVGGISPNSVTIRVMKSMGITSYTRFKTDNLPLSLLAVKLALISGLFRTVKIPCTHTRCHSARNHSVCSFSSYNR